MNPEKLVVDTVVIGGGLAGLMAAQVLTEAGHVMYLFDANALYRAQVFAGWRSVSISPIPRAQMFLPSAMVNAAR